MAPTGVINAETSAGSSLKLAGRQTPVPARLCPKGLELKELFPECNQLLEISEFDFHIHEV
jgi:hypothetical protein